jgi:hypothetical protein
VSLSKPLARSCAQGTRRLGCSIEPDDVLHPVLSEDNAAVGVAASSALSTFDETATCASLAETTAEMTALGFHLATLPVEPRIGKLISYGALFDCVDPALTIAAAAVSSKSPFAAPFGCRELADEARQNFAVDGSDHLTIILEAFNQYRRLISMFYIINFMSLLLLIAIVVQHVVCGVRVFTQIRLRCLPGGSLRRKRRIA